MGMDFVNMDELIFKLEDYGRKANDITKSAVRDGAEIVKNRQQKDAPKDSEKSSKNLKISNVKKTKFGAYAKIGINKDNWDKTKGLYFQHYGYENWGRGGIYNGMYIAKHTGWMDKSFKKCKRQAYQKIKDSLEVALGL